jgi:hypothetical protein
VRQANTLRCVMTTATNTRWITGLCAAVVFAGLACGAALLVPTPAEARVFVGLGFGFPIGFPGYYYPPYPYPYYYPPPPYYPLPPYCPAPGAYPPSAPTAPGGYSPSAGTAGPANHLHPAVALDRRFRPAVPRIPNNPRRTGTPNESLRNSLPRSRRPMARRQLTFPRDA